MSNLAVVINRNHILTALRHHVGMQGFDCHHSDKSGPESEEPHQLVIDHNTRLWPKCIILTDYYTALANTSHPMFIRIPYYNLQSFLYELNTDIKIGRLGCYWVDKITKIEFDSPKTVLFWTPILYFVQFAACFEGIGIFVEVVFPNHNLSTIQLVSVCMYCDFPNPFHWYEGFQLSNTIRN